MNTAFYLFDTDREICDGWKEGLEDCGFNNFYGIPKNINKLPEYNSKIDLWIIENPTEQDLVEFSTIKRSGKVVCLVKDFKLIFKNFSDMVNLWVEPVFFDKETEKKFHYNNLPFHYSPLASQESLIPFYTELNRMYDLSVDEPLKENWNVIVMPKNEPHPEIIYGNTKVNLNYQIPKKDFVYLNKKAFDIPMSGNFELSTIPEVVDIFEGKIGYTSELEMKDKIQYYIDHEEKRTRMAIKAYEIIIRDHVYTYRMRDLLKKLNII